MNIHSLFPAHRIELETIVETDELIRRLIKSFNLNPKRNFKSKFYIEQEFFQGELNGLNFIIRKNDSFRSHSDPHLFMGTEIKGTIIDDKDINKIELEPYTDSTFKGMIIGWFILGLIFMLWTWVIGVFSIILSIGFVLYMRKKNPENLELIQQKVIQEIIY